MNDTYNALAHEEKRPSIRLFLSWNRECTRSINLATRFGARLVSIHPTVWGNSTLIRYILSFVGTLSLIYRQRKAILYTENLPGFLLLAVYLGAKLKGIPYIIDSHSGAFNNPKWKWFLPIYRYIAKGATANIVTNEIHGQLIRSWGGKSETVSDVPIVPEPKTATNRVIANESVLVVLSYEFDEPLHEIFSAIEETPEVTYYLSGNYRKAPQELIKGKPSNAILLGYIPLPEYYAVMHEVAAVMALTNRDNTMQRGAYEAMSLEKPIITSAWDILRNSFGDGALYVKNTVPSIVAAVRKIMNDREFFNNAIQIQKQYRITIFNAAVEKIEYAIRQNDRS